MTPRTLELLPGGIEEREPWPDEKEFFARRLDVSGMAAADDRVVINPYVRLSADQRWAVALNEAARVVIRRTPDLRPEFDPTPEQRIAFDGYGSDDDLRATIAARILSSDPSALAPSQEQRVFVARLARFMGIELPKI